MRTNLDFTPFFRSSIGFDRMFSLLDEANRLVAEGGPSYDIARLGEDGYRIDLAVPGFEMSALTITQQGNELRITGKAPAAGKNVELLHGGLARRDFVQKFELDDHVDVTGAELQNGILSISLKRQLPDALKPRTIPIDTTSTGSPRQIESRKAA